MSDDELEAEITEFLEDPNILERILEYIRKNEHMVGERGNQILTLLTCISAKLDEPNNLDFTGETSGGKSYIAIAISNLFPHNCIRGDFSPKSICNFVDETINDVEYITLTNKIIIVLEKDTADDFLREIRPLLSHDVKETTKMTVVKNKTVRRVIRGFPAAIILGTKGITQEELASRFDVTSPEIHPAKFEQVNREYGVRKAFPFEYNKNEKEFTVISEGLHKLQPGTVIVPFHEYIHKNMDHDEPKAMRDRKRVSIYIESSAILHQYNRLQYILEDGTRYIFANIDDLRIGMELMEATKISGKTGVAKDARKFFRDVILELWKHEKEITYNSTMNKFHEVYNRKPLPLTSHKEKYMFPLKEHNWIHIENENTRPHRYTVNKKYDELDKELIENSDEQASLISRQLATDINETNLVHVSKKIYIKPEEEIIKKYIELYNINGKNTEIQLGSKKVKKITEEIIRRYVYFPKNPVHVSKDIFTNNSGKPKKVASKKQPKKVPSGFVKKNLQTLTGHASLKFVQYQRDEASTKIASKPKKTEKKGKKKNIW